MRISLEQVRAGAVRWDETLAIAAESLQAPELLELSPVTCRGAATFVDPEFHLHADLAWSQTLQCDRCLAAFAVEMAIRFDLVIHQVAGVETARAGLPAPEPAAGRVDEAGGEESEPAIQLEEDDFGVIHVSGDEVLTDGLVSEQILLHLPMKPLCRTECAGLCPTCGADRNLETCECKPPVDQRWAGLEAWISKAD